MLVLKAHVRAKHEVKRDYCCEHCEFKGNSEKSLMKHVGSVHGEHQCDKCKFKSGTKRGLKIHESRIHKLENKQAGIILGPKIKLQNENDPIPSSNSNEEREKIYSKNYKEKTRKERNNS